MLDFTIAGKLNQTYVDILVVLANHTKNFFVSSDVHIEHSLNLTMYLSQYQRPAMGRNI